MFRWMWRRLLRPFGGGGTTADQVALKMISSNRIALTFVGDDDQ